MVGDRRRGGATGGGGAPTALWFERALSLAALAGAAFGLEALGLAGPDGRWILWAFALFAIVVPVRDGLRARSRPAIEGSAPLGVAIAAGWASSVSLLGLAGALFLHGRDGFGFLLGWLGGFLILALAVAPGLRASGAASAPGYLGTRYGAEVEALGAAIAGAAAFGLLTAQLSAAGLVLARFLEVSFVIGVGLGALAVAIGLAFGRPRSASAAAGAAFAALALAYVGPAVWIALGEGLGPVPQVGHLGALDEIASLEAGFATREIAVPAPHFSGSERFSTLDLALLTLCLACGVAGLPHLLRPALLAGSAAEARTGMVWGLGLILLVTLTAPAYATFAKLESYRGFWAGGGTVAFSDMPDWIYRWSGAGGPPLVTVCAGAARDEDSARAACAAQGSSSPSADGFAVDQLRIDPDAVALAAPEMFNAPWAVVGLLGLGVLIAALAAAEASARAIGDAFGRELYARRLRIGATVDDERRAARAAALAIAGAAALWAAGRPADLLTLATWALSLAAGGLFPALALGIWWGRANAVGAVAGMAVGFGTTLFYQIGATVGLDGVAGSGDEIAWWGLDHLTAGALGAAAGAATLAAASLATPTRRRGPEPGAPEPRARRR